MKREDVKKIVNINTEKTKQRFSLTLTFAVLIFIVLVCALAFATALLFLMSGTGALDSQDDSISLGTIVLVLIGFSIFFGATFSLALASVPLRSLNSFIDNMNRLAAGKYSTRMEFKGALANHKVIIEIKDSFNKLAEELEKTEMLRSDFINNFSHEFKTPIVSISGLARLLNKGNLTDEERSRYLTAIEDESRRLATMATNILNLTKVESQSILTDVTTFNLSEQIRSCVLLLEDKWDRKGIELLLDFDEHTVEGNEELLKEVFINLVDNAIKFSPDSGRLAISVEEKDTDVIVKISNEGHISDDDKANIFSKFYKADKSHSSEGNGIGLAIVKRIIDLHRGEISVESEDDVVTFTVVLKKKQ